jgi:hypothetical protein
VHRIIFDTKWNSRREALARSFGRAVSDYEAPADTRSAIDFRKLDAAAND